MSSLHKVNIRPEVNILSVLRHLNYRPWFALAEFVDNAIQSSITNHKELCAIEGADFVLKVRIRIEPEGNGRIVVSDNAAGIAVADFPRAFRPAQIPPDSQGLSEFGMGMKSAACWFAKKWSVRTKALDESVERVVNFDIDKIIEGRIEELTIIENPSVPERHYTELELVELCHVPKRRTLGKIKEHLASIYRVFIRNGSLALELNGEALTYEEVPILKAPPYRKLQDDAIVWKKAIEMDLGGEHRVTGFAALREIGSTTHAGFALFRRNRLIEGSADETYRHEEIFGKPNDYRYQRLFGELHLSGFEVSHTKDGFRWEEHEEIFLELLKLELEGKPINLLDQAEGHRAKQHKKNLDEVALRATDNVAAVVERELAPVIEEEIAYPANPPALPPTISTPSLTGFERTIEVPINTTTWVITLRASTDPSVGDWLRVGDAVKIVADGTQRHSVQVDVSLVHPFVERFAGANNENIELFVRIASAAALAAALSTQAGAKSQFFLYHLNKLLREIFASP